MILRKNVDIDLLNRGQKIPKWTFRLFRHFVVMHTNGSRYWIIRILCNLVWRYFKRWDEGYLERSWTLYRLTPRLTPQLPPHAHNFRVILRYFVIFIQRNVQNWFCDLVKNSQYLILTPQMGISKSTTRSPFRCLLFFGHYSRSYVWKSWRHYVNDLQWRRCVMEDFRLKIEYFNSTSNFVWNS